MGNRNARAQGSGLANYGAGYDPYTGVGGMENYGSFYQPYGGDPYGYGFTDGPFVTSAKPPLGGLGGYGSPYAGGLGGYSSAYAGGFNPMMQFGLGGPKVRQILVPDNVVSAFQNLIQQGCGGGMQMAPPMMPQMSFAPPPMMPQMSFAPPPMMPQMPCAPPPMTPQMSFAPPPMMPQMPQMPCAPPPMMPQMSFAPPPMMPQMPCAPAPVMPQMSFAPPPMMPQMPQMPQLGSNCCSMTIQLPSAAPPMPIAPQAIRKIFFLKVNSMLFTLKTNYLAKNYGESYE